MTKKPKLTKAEQARVDQIKKTKGPVPYKGGLLKRVTAKDIFTNPKGWMK